MFNLKIRLKFAWNAFNFKPMKHIFPSYKAVAKLKPASCDFSTKYLNGEKAAGYGFLPCNNNSISCISRTTIELTVESEDHVHLCNECAEKMMAKKGD